MHLLTAITPHGFGHAAQVAPVLNALHGRLPDLRITLYTDLPAAFLRGRIRSDFEQIAQAPDFGLLMDSALAIDLESSAAAYRRLHNDWEQQVAEQARVLRRLDPDLILVDVPYLTLAAAAVAGIPAVAMCSLNWADIYRHYFSGREEAARVLEQMQAAYRSAQAFLCPEPSMPMDWLDNRVAVGPIAGTGRAQPEQLRRRLPRSVGDQRIVLVAPGGVKARFPIDQWPHGQGIHWLVSADWQARHPDVSHYQDTGLAFTDLIASCDAVLGKCGYGTVTECVANATPLLYVPRPDWPEEPTLLRWLEAHGAALAVAPERLDDGCFADLLPALAAMRVRPCPTPGGDEAACHLERLLVP